MTKLIKSIRGMPDILPEATPRWQNFEKIWNKVAGNYAYQEIRLPIVESTSLFARSIGDVTDIVEKEMFTFQDRDEESLSLRPEGTAGCVRAGIEHGLLYNQIQRLWYQGQMFRYERPQKGRYRQFNQIGVEAFGLSGPDIDVEQILLAKRLWEELKITDGVKLQINTLGSNDSRAKYRDLLVDYLQTNFEKLDEDSKNRVNKNPLRVLDSKNPLMQDIIKNAPSLHDNLDNESKEHFEKFKELLDSSNVSYEVNPTLVRGLDYYNYTVYEWVTDKLGSQGTICAGGRYDTLVETLGGKPTPAVGFALGIERVLLLQQEMGIDVNSDIDVYLIAVGDSASNQALNLAELIRSKCNTVKLLTNCSGGNFKSQFKRADKSGAKLALIIGDEELAHNTVGIKFLREDRAQLTVSLDKIGDFVNGFLIDN